MDDLELDTLLTQAANDPAMAVHFSSKTVEWQTPSHIVELAHRVMGGINLDPASPGKDRTVVVADTYYTKTEDGLWQDWYGWVYLNPEYGRAIGKWMRKLRAEWDIGHVTQFIALVPARVDTSWWREFVTTDMIVCNLHKRLKFLDSNGNEQDAAPFPSSLIYGGGQEDVLRREVKGLGSCYRLLREPV